MLKYDERHLSLQYTPERCIGCGRCLEVCPHGVFVLEERGGKTKSRIRHRGRCMECGACHWNCPADALWVRRGVGCAWALVNEGKNRLLSRLERSAGCKVPSGNDTPAGPETGNGGPGGPEKT